MTSIVFWLAIALSAVNFFAEVLSPKIEKFHSKILSISSGVFIAYLFVAFLPETVKGTAVLGEQVFLLMLFGFAVFHVLEKYLYQHVKNKDKLLEELSHLHKIGFALDHFIIGMVLFFAANIEDFTLGLLIVIPLFLHVVSSSIALNHIHEHSNKKTSVIFLLSIMPLLGTIFASLINQFNGAYQALFSVSLGALLYVSIRDMIPKEGGEKIAYFLAGIIISLIAISAAKTVQAAGMASFFII